LLDADFIAKNYSTIYHTTGGGTSNEDALNFARKFVDNRVLDVYLKILGVATLTPTTLVPVALIFGQQVFKKVIKHMRKTEQRGGSIPVFDDKLIGTYLKVAGLTQLSLSLNTLVPLGLAMAIYATYKQQETRDKPKSSSRRQRGGHINRLFIGNSVPAGFLKLQHNYWNGNTIQNNIYAPLNSYNQGNRSLSFMNMELQPSVISSSDAVSGASLNAHGMQVEVPAVSSESVSQVNAVPSEFSTGVESESANSGHSVLVLPNTMA
jgi:hypothetical protein